MAVIHTRLEGFVGAEFGKAEALFRRAAMVQVVVAGLAAASVFDVNPTINAVVAVVALALYGAWAVLDWQYRDARGQAERGRRVLLIADGLGGTVSPGELREVEAGFSVSQSKGKEAQNLYFFASDREFGEARLTELLEESSFYSCRLYRLSATWAWRRFVVAIAMCMLLLITLPSLMQSEQVALYARVVSTVLIFLVGQEVLGTARAYSRAHEALTGMQARVRAIRELDHPLGDLLLLLGDYNSAVEGAPLMAPDVYKRAAPRLDELWRTHLEQGAGKNG